MISLPEDFLEKRGQGLVQLIEMDVLDQMSRYRMVAEHRSLYFNTATVGMPLPWVDASNIHLPLMMEKTETLVPMLMSAFWGIDPVVTVQRSPDEYMEEQTDDTQQFMNFVVEKDVPDLYETMENWMRDMGLDGMSYVHPYWVTKSRMVSELHHLKIAYDTGQSDANGVEVQDARMKSAEELLVELFGTPDIEHGLIHFQPDEEYEDMAVIGTEWYVQFMENRMAYVGEVEFLPSRYVDEVTARVRRPIVCEDNAHVDNIDYEDLILPYRTVNIQKSDRVTHKYWLTVDEIEEKVRHGEWQLTEQDMDLLRASGTRRYEEGHMDTGLKTQKDQVTGETRNYGNEKKLADGGFAPYNRNKVMCFAVYMTDVVDPEDAYMQAEEVIYHIPYPLRKIVRADYLDEVFPHGKRPFVAAKYIPITNRASSLGLGDQLAAINLEINTIVNYVNNNQELVNNPFFFYEPTALNSDTKGLKNIAPGNGIPVLSVQGIMFPSFQHTPLANMEMLTSLLMFADRLTISPMNAGSTQMKNAPRTARGTLAMLGEGHVKVDMLITRLQRTSWMELMEQLFGLYQVFCPDEKWYWVTRDNEKHRMRMTRDMLRGRYEFTFKGNTVNTNREVLRNIAQVRYSTMMTHPDYSTDPRVRINAAKDFLSFWGDGTDITRLLPALPGEGAYTHPPMRQQDENKVIEMGVPMQVLPTDPHAEHLQVMDMWEKSDQFNQMPPHAVGLYAMHKLQHQQMLQAQAQQQNLPVGPGMANNVPTGATLGGGGEGTQDSNVMGGGNMR